LGEVYEQLNGCKARSRLLLLDGWRHDWKKRDPPAGFVRDRAREVIPAGATAVLLSCSKGERGYENLDERHGMFFMALLRELRQPGGGRLGALANSVQRRVVDLTHAEFKGAQTPELVCANPDEPRPPLSVEGALAAYSRGCDLEEHGKYNEAVLAFNEASDKGPSFLDPWLHSAAAHFRCDRYAEAVAACDAALKLSPDDATAHSYRAEILTEMLRKPKEPKASKLTKEEWEKLFQEALDNHAQAITRDPAYALAYNTRGRTYLVAEKYPEAIKEFEKALERNPRLMRTLQILAGTHSKLRQFDEVIKVQTRAIELAPNFGDAYKRRAAAYRQRNAPGDEELAEKDEATVKALKNGSKKAGAAP
jgi:tetratricopeptide (TPR) repeat protein